MGPQYFIGDEVYVWIDEKAYAVGHPEIGHIKLTLEELGSLVKVVQQQLPELALDLPAYQEGYKAGAQSMAGQKPEMRSDKDSPFIAAQNEGRRIGYRHGYETAVQRMKGMLTHIFETPHKDAEDDEEEREES